ncbi:MAG: HAD family phosphatase [Treponema sp.]|nr:HAD family phosphatase [Treponema sp.]
MSIKAVAFDYGGVISMPQDGEAMRDMAAIAGIDAALMYRIYWNSRPLYDQDLVSGEEYFKNMLADVGVFPDPGAVQRLIDRDLASWSRVNPLTEQLMRDLKAAGFKLGILSNMIRPFVDHIRESLPVLGLPDEAVYSCDVDAVKPEEKIYRILLSRLDCGPEEVVFFDDAEANVEAARDLGMAAFFWESPGAARKELEILGAGRF